ncbi:unnamed protein product [Amoebophrya sp. A25]|nr:unnamed protein product [Amoebophrya sp. A25]|eukprot:GSA25T00027605001.1
MMTMRSIFFVVCSVRPRTGCRRQGNQQLMNLRARI